MSGDVETSSSENFCVGIGTLRRYVGAMPKIFRKPFNWKSMPGTIYQSYTYWLYMTGEIVNEQVVTESTLIKAPDPFCKKPIDGRFSLRRWPVFAAKT